MAYRFLLASGFGLLLSTQGAAQQPVPRSAKDKNRGLFNVTQVGYNRGLGTARFRDDVALPNRGYVVRLRTTFGYFVSPHTSVGLGFGLDGYHNPGYNTAPLVADVRHYRRPTENSVFFGANAGYSLKLGPAFQQGMVGGANVGYRLIWGRATHVLLSAGLDLHQMRDARLLLFTPTSVERLQSNIWLKSASFNAGLLF